jgi:hypothetical protein
MVFISVLLALIFLKSIIKNKKERDFDAYVAGYKRAEAEDLKMKALAKYMEKALKTGRPSEKIKPFTDANFKNY